MDVISNNIFGIGVIWPTSGLPNVLYTIRRESWECVEEYREVHQFSNNLMFLTIYGIVHMTTIGSARQEGQSQSWMDVHTALKMSGKDICWPDALPPVPVLWLVRRHHWATATKRQTASPISFRPRSLGYDIELFNESWIMIRLMIALFALRIAKRNRFIKSFVNNSSLKKNLTTRKKESLTSNGSYPPSDYIQPSRYLHGRLCR